MRLPLISPIHPHPNFSSPPQNMEKEEFTHPSITHNLFRPTPKTRASRPIIPHPIFLHSAPLALTTIQPRHIRTPLLPTDKWSTLHISHYWDTARRNVKQMAYQRRDVAECKSILAIEDFNCFWISTTLINKNKIKPARGKENSLHSSTSHK